MRLQSLFYIFFFLPTTYGVAPDLYLKYLFATWAFLQSILVLYRLTAFLHLW